MVGPWWAHGGPMVGPWWAHGGPMVGPWWAHDGPPHWYYYHIIQFLLRSVSKFHVVIAELN